LSRCDRIDVVRNHVVLRVVLLGLAAILLGAGPVSAHAALAGTDPEDGTSLATAPTSITFTFNENIGTPAYVAVTASVADVDQRGTYSASYRVVSADGHPVTGTIRYDVTTGRTVTQVEAPDDDTFLHRHSAHFFWGILAAVVAIALLLAPLRRRHDADST
jgi:methionine-rich copper-binding protein CopC